MAACSRSVATAPPPPSHLSEVWDPATGTFSPAGSLTEARSIHTATLLTDGRVLLVGGWGTGPLASAEVWDPATGTFSATGSLAEDRGGHGATLLADGRVLAVGGDGSAGSLASAEVWDPATGTFSATGSLTEARSNHTATLLPDGRVLVVGGNDFFILDSAEVWEGGRSGVLAAQAQDELDWRGARPFMGTGTLIRQDPLEWTVGPDYSEATDIEAEVYILASDPRISGWMRQVSNLRSYPTDGAGDAEVFVWSATVRITNEYGAWVGEISGYDEGTFSKEWYILEGEGFYEGLVAVFRWLEEGDALDGVIVPGDLPPLPEPPPAE